MIFLLLHAYAAPLLTLQDSSGRLDKPEVLINGEGPISLDKTQGSALSQSKVWEVDLDQVAPSELRIQLNDGDTNYGELEVVVPEHQKINLLLKRGIFSAQTAQPLFSATAAELPKIDSKEQLELSIQNCSGWILTANTQQYTFAEETVLVQLLRKEFHTFTIRDPQNAEMELVFKVQMPSTGGAKLALVRSGDQLSRTNQRAVAGKTSSKNAGEEQPATQFNQAPSQSSSTQRDSEKATAQGDDLIRLKFTLSAPDAPLLSSPELLVSSSAGNEDQSVDINDDGADGDATAQDRVWYGEHKILKGEYLQIKLIDEQQEQGSVKVFMSSGSQGLIELLLKDGKLEHKAQKLSHSNPPINDLNLGGNRNILMALAFAAGGFFYLFVQIWLRWKRDVLPTLSLLQEFLAAQETDSTQRDENQSSTESVREKS